MHHFKVQNARVSPQDLPFVFGRFAWFDLPAHSSTLWIKTGFHDTLFQPMGCLGLRALNSRSTLWQAINVQVLALEIVLGISESLKFKGRHVCCTCWHKTDLLYQLQGDPCTKCITSNFKLPALLVALPISNFHRTAAHFRSKWAFAMHCFNQWVAWGWVFSDLPSGRPSMFKSRFFEIN